MRLEQNLLLFSLEKKCEKLKQVKEITLWQAKADKGDMAQYGQKLKQKQDIIDEIKRLDSGFESVLPKVLPALQQNPAENKEMITKFQTMISQIQQLEMEISEQEKSNFNTAKLKNLQRESKEKIALPRKEAAKLYRKTKNQ